MVTMVRTRFRPENGFAFPNAFHLPTLFSRPADEGRRAAARIFGLCGGMCYAALDYYYAHLPVPPQSQVPGPESSLYRYLVRRQLDSLIREFSVLPKVFLGMLMGDAPLKWQTVSRHLPPLLHQLDVGVPAVLVIWRVGGLSDPTQNHQVIATGYRLDELEARTSLFLYDPNYPGQEPTITIDQADGIELAQSTGERVRGFFVQRYQLQVQGLAELGGP